MDNKSTMTLRSSNKVRQSIAYTEDNVAVYNVMIEKLSNNIQLKHIRQHFSKFGQIKDVYITYGKTRRTPAQCIIKYQNVEGASATLKKRYHTVNHQRIIVKACPSWEQPFEMECPSMENNCLSLVLLNDYCLEEIFKNLDLRQQIRLSLCHPRLKQVFMQMICPRLPRHVNFERLWYYSTWELRQFFYTVGYYIESILVGRRYLTLSAKNNSCTFMKECNMRVRRLHIMSLYSWVYNDFLNALSLDYITDLELYNCNLCDFDLECLRKLRNLRALGLACNHRIEGIHLMLFCKLERLSLYGCESITDEVLMWCCQHLQLIYLDIRMTDGIQQPEKCIEYCKTLDTLKVSCVGDAIAKSIEKLPKLKSLEVRHLKSASMASIFYSTLADHHADDLLELKLSGQTCIMFPSVGINIARLHKLRTLWLGDDEFNVSKELIEKLSNLSDLEEISLPYSTYIRDKYLLPLIRTCTKLKRINLRMCRHVTKNLIWNTLDILQQRAAATKVSPMTQKIRKTIAQPLVMLVHGTRIRKDILQSTTYQKGQHLLKLLFHGDKPLMGLTNEGTPFDINDSAVNCNTPEDSDSYSDGYSDAYIDSDSDDDFEYYYG
ncbi:uncharacterized protein LOC118744764 isoform X1 [Rhagoletis pomonella]|uniref:uncharacterized protein LOC118744764 isoform X1 n=2 Tax=Rhagoletis pomonella TaxID=28610 RepID=UPI0017854A29|nr:uncharacterized protein LOC118744764 isoform X1 [Rhagoletis pomonella]